MLCKFGAVCLLHHCHTNTPRARRWLASTAHNLSLACGLKNDVNQIGSLVGSFDFFVNE